jgi:hypothetical protein
MTTKPPTRETGLVERTMMPEQPEPSSRARRPLSRPTIVDEAISVIDEDGLPAVLAIATSATSWP